MEETLKSKRIRELEEQLASVGEESEARVDLLNEFVDLLSFLRIEGRWRIISKVYHAAAS